ncbi:hypothetical protein MAHJHV65_43620 [Mycobacterium avium subsp. hominissuis]|uniref:hypothetical protein n=1 Tax=Mycobacterium avium TaxID=1764 RepID=UPI0007A09A81|nr:hypothetical protein [Mycobacterium avium]MBZ4508391.1 hypothetical protein [Mycobacterium avium subsp. hominissuis]MCA2295899.1 hypothetical protein [Mycobacterium avium]
MTAVTLGCLTPDDQAAVVTGRIRAVLDRYGCSELTVPAGYHTTAVLTAELPLCPVDDEDREGWRVFLRTDDGRLRAPFEPNKAIWAKGATVIAPCPHGGQTRLERCLCGIRYVPDPAVFPHTVDLTKATYRDGLALPAGWRIVAARGTAEGAVHRDVSARGDGYISFHEYRRAQRFRIADLFYTD